METLRERLIRTQSHLMTDAEIEDALDHQDDEGAIEFLYGGRGEDEDT